LLSTEGQVVDDGGGNTATTEFGGPALLNLALEWWRLECWLTQLTEPTCQARVRRFRRVIDGILDRHDIRVRDFTGQPLTEGLAVEIVDVVDDLSVPEGLGVIAEMLSPTVSHGDSVIRYGQAVVRRRPLPSSVSDPATGAATQAEPHSQREQELRAPSGASHREHRKGHKRGRHL
jgi:hypothetical protein